MKVFRDILLIIGIFALLSYTPKLLQISAGVVQSQNVGVPPVANDGLVYLGSGGIDNPIGDNIINNIISTDADWDTVACAYHCLAIKSGRLYAWGSGAIGRTSLQPTYNDLFDTTFLNTNVPTQIGSDTNWTCIGVGFGHSLAIESGRLYAWGNNSNGQLGRNNTTNLNTPTQVGSDTDWTWCSAGNTWSAAIKSGQLLTCGNNNSFRTGLNTSTGNTLVFTIADASTTWVKVSCADLHGLGIRTDSLYSWGSNANGRTGQGTASGSTQVPTMVGALTGWTKINVGIEHSFASIGNQLYAFGHQRYGRLGDGVNSFSNQLTPISIGTGYIDFTTFSYNHIIRTNGTGSMTPHTSYAIRNDSLFATGGNSLYQYGVITANKSYSTFQLIDSTKFNYKKLTATPFGVVAIRGN